MRLVPMRSADRWPGGTVAPNLAGGRAPAYVAMRGVVGGLDGGVLVLDGGRRGLQAPGSAPAMTEHSVGPAPPGTGKVWGSREVGPSIGWSWRGQQQRRAG